MAAGRAGSSTPGPSGASCCTPLASSPAAPTCCTHRSRRPGAATGAEVPGAQAPGAQAGVGEALYQGCAGGTVILGCPLPSGVAPSHLPSSAFPGAADLRPAGPKSHAWLSGLGGSTPLSTEPRPPHVVLAVRSRSRGLRFAPLGQRLPGEESRELCEPQSLVLPRAGGPPAPVFRQLHSICLLVGSRPKGGHSGQAGLQGRPSPGAGPALPECCGLCLSTETQLILLLFVKKVTHCVKMQIVTPQDKVDDFKH